LGGERGCFHRVGWENKKRTGVAKWAYRLTLEGGGQGLKGNTGLRKTEPNRKETREKYEKDYETHKGKPTFYGEKGVKSHHVVENIEKRGMELFFLQRTGGRTVSSGRGRNLPRKGGL